MKIIIIGAGIAGLATSIALSKHISPAPDITLIELRPVLSSIGGAIGLTPNALRALNHLGVLQGLRERGLGCDVKRIELFGIYSGARLGEIDFDGQGGGIGSNEAGKFRGLRIMRKDLVAALLDRARQCDNVRIEFGRKMKGIDETNESIRVSFEDGNHISGHMLIGCDGVHSSVRKLVVHPDRVPEYTGIAAVFGFADVAGVQDTGATIPWDTTGLCQSRRGSLLCSFCEPMKNEVFLGAIMETKDVQSKEGWKAKAAEQEQIKKSVWERYSGSKMDCLDALIEQSRDWSLYPVYTLGPGGTWSSKRTILLGDAAHAMPPQGESGGMALEDAILFARVLAVNDRKPLHEQFLAYEKLRRPRVDKAYQEATFGWDTQKDSGWIAFYLRSWITSWFLWWTSASRLKRYSEDIGSIDLNVDG